MGFSQKRDARLFQGDVAQLGEHLPCKQEVSGSTPLISTIMNPAYHVQVELARAMFFDN